jgi:hypothetical protein
LPLASVSLAIWTLPPTLCGCSTSSAPAATSDCALASMSVTDQ